MRPTLFSLFLMMPLTTFAQNFQGMSEADLEKMMQSMNEMQSCMEKVDEQKVEALEQRSEQTLGEVRALCASGERDLAKQTAMQYGEEMANDQTIKQIRECGDMMKFVMPNLALFMNAERGDDQHICDSQ